MVTQWSELVERNRLYAQNKHQPMPFIEEAVAAGRPPASIFVFACCDPRAPTEAMLGLQGEAVLSRNLGGRVMNSLKDLLYVDFVFGGQGFKEVAIIHHTDCGLTHGTDAGFHAHLKAAHPELADEIDRMEPNSYDGSDMDKQRESVLADIAYLKASPFVREELKRNVYGYVFDIKTGKLIPVV